MQYVYPLMVELIVEIQPQGFNTYEISWFQLTKGNSAKKYWPFLQQINMRKTKKDNKTSSTLQQLHIIKNPHFTFTVRPVEVFSLGNHQGPASASRWSRVVSYDPAVFQISERWGPSRRFEGSATFPEDQKEMGNLGEIWGSKHPKKTCWEWVFLKVFVCFTKGWFKKKHVNLISSHPPADVPEVFI